MNAAKSKPDRLFFPSVRLCRAEFRGEGVLRPRELDKCGLLAVESGRAALSIDGRTHTAEAGDRFWLVPGTALGGRWEAGFRVTLLLFSCCRMQKYAGQWLAAEAELPASGRLERSAGLPERLPGLAGEAPPRDRLELKHALHRWMSVRQTESAAGDTRSGLLKSTKEEAGRSGIDPALAYMSGHYAREVSIEEMAVRSGMSVNHFIRTFKARTGRTPAQYLLHLRMTRAKQLLFSSDKIKTIARSVGYKDEHYFSRAFKKSEGIAPGQYMKRSDLRIATVYYGLDDYLTTLGISPVAVLSYERRIPRIGESAPAKSDEPGASVRLDSSAFSYAKLGRAAPDLILTSSRLDADAQLERIAPTVTLSYSNDLVRQLRQMGGIFGRQNEAEDWIGRYEAKRKSMRVQLTAQAGRRMTAYYIRVGATLCRVYGALNQTGALLYDDLGLQLPDHFPAGEWALNIGPGQLPLFDADWLFMAVEPTPEAAGRMRAIEASDEWQSLRAVREGRICDAQGLLFKALGPAGRLEAMHELFDRMTEETG